MKRRADDSLKQESSLRCVTGVYSHGHAEGNRPHSPQSVRILSSPTSVVQSTYSVGKTEREICMPGTVTFPVQNYSSAMPGATSNTTPKAATNSGLQGGSNIQTQARQQHPMHPAQGNQPLRHKVHTGSATPAVSLPSPMPIAVNTVSVNPAQSQQFQRLKVEDALSYLDQVKYKFGNQPQVYNDFLDIMKEFKSQSIDTPGVIQRVSNLFKGHPELIVGFNTFLPPGYKIEVQANDQGYAFQVSVSMPSPTSSTTTSSLVHSGQHHNTVIPQGSAHSPPQSLPVVVTTQAGTTVHTIPIGSQATPKNSSLQNIHSSSGGSGVHSSAPATPVSHATHHTPTTTTTTSQTPHFPGHQPNNHTPNNTHHNSHHHSAAHHAISQAHQALSHGDGNGPQPTQQSQPVEFNHAINYVNKIKNRFQGQPDKYKRFLEILHTYQKEQRNMKESRGDSPGKHLTEAEVYSQVAKLFENQDDLLAEFGQFLPDATSHSSLTGSKSSNNDHSSIIKKSSNQKPSFNNSISMNRDSTPTLASSGLGSSGKFGHGTGQVKRSPSFSSGGSHGPPPPKKQKTVSLRDVTLAEAGKYGSLNDYAFFDKTRKALKNPDVYENFLRCLTLFNNEIVSRSELVQLVTPFLGKFPELFRWFKEFMGHTDNVMSGQNQSHHLIEPVANNVARQDRPVGELAMEIDYSTCKRLGASYCALPKSYAQPKCSGRTALCREVLNDTWVSFPTWSEDSTFVTSRKTQYEEYIYRCEDERFELDVVIETNAATIRVLEGVHKKLQRLSSDEVAKFRLDDNLGGSSPTIHQRAIRRIYGDKAQDIIDGLKKNPLVAVPVVLRRLKAKEEEWRENQKGFNKIWREQNEKYYLKSLDHQGINFKQNDVKALRSKSLFNEIETIFDERHEQAEEGSACDIVTGPHLVLPYKDKSIIVDAANLLIHHVKRQTGIHKDDKQRIKQLLRHFVPDLFFHPRQDLSDDEREDEDEKEDVDMEGCTNSNTSNPFNAPSVNNAPPSTASSTPTAGTKGRKGETPIKKEPDAGGGGSPDADDEDEDDESGANHQSVSCHPDEMYVMFIGNNHWYLFLRLHQILCDRLTRMLERAVFLAAEEKQYRQDRKDSTAVALRLKPKSEIEVQDYYPAFLDMVKNVLDGNMDSNAYEDTLREMFGIHAYIAFTLDKVVTYAVRQLQHLVTDDSCQECVEMFLQEQRRGGAGGSCSTAHQRAAEEMAYQKRAEQSLADENSFKIYVYKHDCKITIELLETEVEEPEVAETDKWSQYIERFADNGPDGVGGGNSTPRAQEDREDDDLLDISEDGDEVESEAGSSRRRKATFLARNLRSYRQRSGAKLVSLSDVGEYIETRPWNKRDVPAERGEERTKPESEDKKTDVIKDKGSSSSSDDEKSPLEKRLNNTTTNSGENREMVVEDNTQCRFNINSFKRVFVINKENFLYRRRALDRARECHPSVSVRLSDKFQRWHTSWAEDNVTEVQQKVCFDWLMGRVDGLVPNRTRQLTDNDLAKSPYRSYNRFRVDRLVVTSAVVKEEAPTTQ